MSNTPACPRCGSLSTKRISASPVAEAWEIYGCTECNYLWRSIEDLGQIAKLTPEDRKRAIWLYQRKKAGLN